MRQGTWFRVEVLPCACEVPSFHSQHLKIDPLLLLLASASHLPRALGGLHNWGCRMILDLGPALKEEVGQGVPTFYGTQRLDDSVHWKAKGRLTM